MIYKKTAINAMVFILTNNAKDFMIITDKTTVQYKSWFLMVHAAIVSLGKTLSAPCP